MSIELNVKIAGLKLRNPTILSSGFLGVSGKLLKRVAGAGAGAVTTKSIGMEPRKGHPNPTVLEFGHGIINAVGLSNSGYERFKEEIKIAKQGRVPVIASIFAGDSEDFSFLAKEMEDAEADAVELNISCPNLKPSDREGSRFIL
jgi:dihydroorotate dehydrogenase (NAD+) catalytic subunit